MWKWLLVVVIVCLVWAWSVSGESPGAAYDRGYRDGWMDTCKAIHRENPRVSKAVDSLGVC